MGSQFGFFDNDNITVWGCFAFAPGLRVRESFGVDLAFRAKSEGADY